MFASVYTSVTMVDFVGIVLDLYTPGVLGVLNAHGVRNSLGVLKPLGGFNASLHGVAKESIEDSFREISLVDSALSNSWNSCQS